MKVQALLLVALLTAATPVAEPRYFTHVRDITISGSARQSYVVVDEDIWRRCRKDLGDIRLFAAQQEVPYALRVQGAGQTVTSAPVKLLQVGAVDGRTSFFLDLEKVDEYDRVTLDLGRKDFVATAAVEGRDEVKGKPTTLGVFTVYDFSREDLGRSTLLKLPRSRFRYLRVQLSAPLRPQEVLGATVANVHEQVASWTPHAVQPAIERSGKATVVRWQSSGAAPLDRVEFQLPPESVNFRRQVTLKNAENRTVASGEISRVRLRRGGRVVEREELALEVPGVRSERFILEVENGDDPPLPFTAVLPQATERRLYFAPRGQTSLRLYYNDSRLETPVYDFAKLFQADPNAVRAQLGPDTRNPAYTPRPDDRPWSERHPLVLWLALVLAVLGLGLVALRGLKT